MNLKRLFMFDLGRLIPGRKAAPTDAYTVEDLVPVRLWRGLVGRGGFELSTAPFSPGAGYLALGRNWRGPVYLSGTTWRKDLQFITDQLLCIVRTNAPLARGLDAVAREERRASSGFTSIRSLRNTLLYMVPLVILIALCGYVGISIQAPPSIILLLAVLPLLVWSGLRAHLLDRRRLLLAVLVAGAAAATFAAAVMHLEVSNFPSLLRRSGLGLNTYQMEIAVMLIAVIPVLVLFLCLWRMTRSGGAREMVLLRLRDRIESGERLSEAMRRLPRFFPRFHADMVEAGEESGRMAECLEQLSNETQSGVQGSQHIRNTFLYLGIVASVQGLIALFLIMKVIPVFIEIHEEFQEVAPSWGPGHLFQWLDNTVSTWYTLVYGRYHLEVLLPGALLLGLFAVGVAIVVRNRRRGISSRSLAGVLLFIPGFRSLVMHGNFTVITLTLEKLLRAGVPLDQALEKAAAGDLNPVYARMLRRVRARILQGEGFGDAFEAESSGITTPASFAALTSVGEHSGMLPDALAYLHAFYRVRAEVRGAVLVETVRPLGIVALGLATLYFMLNFFWLFVGLTVVMLDSL